MLNNMHLALSISVLLFLSATPLCSGVYGAVSCLYYVEHNTPETYFPLVLVLRVCSFFPVLYFSKRFIDFKLLKDLIISFQKMKRIECTFLEKSSIKVAKYFALPQESVYIGLQRFECSVNQLVALFPLHWETFIFVDCPLYTSTNFQLMGFSKGQSMH